MSLLDRPAFTARLPSPRIEAAAWLRHLGRLALAAGVGVWGALLLAPAPAPMPPALGIEPATGADTTPVAQWFGGGSTRVRVGISGLIAGAEGRGLALLSVNGGPVQAYREGQTLAPGVVLHAVEAAAVAVDQDGVIERVAAPPLPAGAAGGFVRVPPAGR